MTPKERKIELMRRDRTMTEIAKELGVTVNHVSQVVLGHRRSSVVEEAVAKAIGKPVGKVFDQQSQTAQAVG